MHSQKYKSRMASWTKRQNREGERERERETYCNNFLLRSERSAEVGAGALFAATEKNLRAAVESSSLFFQNKKFLPSLSLTHSFLHELKWVVIFFACSLLHSNLHYPQYLALSARKPCASHFFHRDLFFLSLVNEEAWFS